VQPELDRKKISISVSELVRVFLRLLEQTVFTC